MSDSLNSTIVGYPTIPLHPPNSGHNTPGYSIAIGTTTTNYAIGGINDNYSRILGGNNINLNSPHHAMILGGSHINLNGPHHTTMISATDRPFDQPDLDTSKSIYLRSDQGVFIEDPDQHDHFINLTQELSQTRQELQELKELVQQLYYAPGAPGYVQAQSDFEYHQSEAKSS